jgi:hypothetical protein
MIQHILSVHILRLAEGVMRNLIGAVVIQSTCRGKEEQMHHMHGVHAERESHVDADHHSN